MAIGAGVSVLCFLGITYIKPRLGYDDALDAFGVHGIGGIWGALATGLFASKAVNPAGADGLFFGNPGQLWIQAIAVAATLVYSGVGTFIIYKVLDAIIGMRVGERDENIGLDLTQHREAGYTLIE
jgi:Amt family ammonium transporter